MMVMTSPRLWISYLGCFQHKETKERQRDGLDAFEGTTGISIGFVEIELTSHTSTSNDKCLMFVSSYG